MVHATPIHEARPSFPRLSLDLEHRDPTFEALLSHVFVHLGFVGKILWFNLPVPVQEDDPLARAVGSAIRRFFAVNGSPAHYFRCHDHLSGALPFI